MAGRYVQAQVAVDSRERAAELARSAVEARLAACVQVVGPIVSTYRWQGAVETAEEYLLLAKTRADLSEALAEHIRAAHPYDVPEIITVPIEHGLPDYLAWIDAETS
ncbi:divalent-cation tolerance protein CutA [Bailinhaonella thermotolerans]|uniref:divalent-cation tolerance protein CutA n=1 Tax=Bailinhaonella thermotolerans TaxID=1070861 RepID=UPI001F5B3CA7|nr:divalent-cation tolerance protein CutA [Bailinhaonella thermotolerans]